MNFETHWNAIPNPEVETEHTRIMCQHFYELGRLEAESAANKVRAAAAQNFIDKLNRGA